MVFTFGESVKNKLWVLLKLPAKEREYIAEQIINSLFEEELLTEEDKEDLKIAEQRLENIKKGKSRLLSSSEFEYLLANRIIKK